MILTRVRTALVSAAMALSFLLAHPSLAANRPLEGATLRVCMYPIGAPNAFFQDSVRDLNGIDVDIIAELRRRLGFALAENRIFPMEYKDSFNLMEKGDADLVLGGLSFTAERTRRFAATRVYHKTYMSVLFSKSHTPQLEGKSSLAELKGMRVYVDAAFIDENFTSLYGFEAVPITNLTLAVFDVAYGKADALIYDAPPLQSFARDLDNHDLMLMEAQFRHSDCQYVMYMNRLSPFRRSIDKALSDMINDGTVDAILKKWGG